MKGYTLNKYLVPHLGVLSLSLLLSGLGACAKQASKVVENKVETTTTPASQITNTRICTDKITNISSADIGAFFGKVVRNLEGPPTFCLTLNATAGASGAKGTLRIEYEDDFGIRYYKIGEEGTYYGKLTQTASQTTIEIVFIDDAGFIQVTATDPGSGTSTGTIKYYNFPSYQDALTAAVQDAAMKCKVGPPTYPEYTVAHCLGYNFSSAFWWNQPIPTSPQQQMLDQAKAILADPTKTKTLGNIEFDLGQVLTQ